MARDSRAALVVRVAEAAVGTIPASVAPALPGALPGSLPRPVAHIQRRRGPGASLAAA